MIAFIAPPVRAQQDIPFAEVNGKTLFLDAAIPEGSGPHPAVIIVHGGGWVRGNRQLDVAPLFQPLSDAGFAWFSIDYRLTQDISQFGSAVADIQSAIRFVKAHAAEYRVDPENLALIGESAGGQLVAMAALDPAPGTQAQAVVTMYAPADLSELLQHSDYVPRQIRESFRGTPFEQFILARAAQMSPINHVKADAPPFLLIHGTADRLIPFSQSRSMCDRLKAVGASCELFPVEGGQHGIRWWESSHPRQAAAYKRELVRWLKEKLSPTRQSE